MLCLALGIPSPRHLRQTLTASDLRGWSRYYDLQPFGHLREDFRSAIIAYVMASCHSKGKQRIENFMLESAAAKRARLSYEQPMDEMKAVMNSIAAQINGNNDR